MKKTTKLTTLILAVMMIAAVFAAAPVEAGAKSVTKTVKASKSYKYNGREYFKYEFKYDKLTAKSAAAKKVNKSIKKAVDGARERIYTMAKSVKGDKNANLPLFVKVSVKLTYNKKGIYSFKYTESNYSGGAHGYYFSAGFNYSKKTGKKLSNSKLTSYSAKTLKTKIYNKLKKLDEKTPGRFFTGAVDGVKNRKLKEFVFWLEGNNLHVYFAPYDISPYMAGDTELKIKL